MPLQQQLQCVLVNLGISGNGEGFQAEKNMPSDFARNDSLLQLWISFHSDFEQKNIQFFF
jgi:hypothetical protein